MDEKNNNDWQSEKNLVHFQLQAYGEQLKELTKTLNNLDKKIEVLNTKIMFGAGAISVIISIISKFISFGGTPHA